MIEGPQNGRQEVYTQSLTQNTDLSRASFSSPIKKAAAVEDRIKTDSRKQSLKIEELEHGQGLLGQAREHFRMMTLGAFMGATLTGPVTAMLFSGPSIYHALAASFSFCTTVGIAAGSIAASGKNDLLRRIGFELDTSTQRPRNWNIQDEKDSLTIQIASLREEQGTEAADKVALLGRELLKLEQDPRDFHLRRRCQKLGQESTVKELLSVLFDCLSNGKEEFIDFYAQNGISSPIDRVRELSWSPERLAKAIDRDSNPRTVARLDERRRQHFDWEIENKELPK